MIHRKVALIVFYDDENRILIQDRRKMSKRGEEWGFFGGGIEEGETPEEAVLRETKEELDWNLLDHKYLGLISCNENNKYICDKHVFISPLNDKLNKFKQLEGDGMKLFSYDEAKKLKMGFEDYKVIDAIKEYLMLRKKIK